MVDTLTAERRSEVMRRIRSKDTAPEKAVRSYLHARGLRFRLHRKDLPGRPDLIFPSRRIALFVHGCFWHGCETCIDGRRAVKSNVSYWNKKVQTNRERDARNTSALQSAGWKVLVVWECEISEERLGALADEIGGSALA